MPCCSSRAFHASLNVTSLDRSVAFYRTFFGIEPAKLRRDYAKFELDDPPLVLSLIPGHSGAGGSLNHFGLRVADSEALVAIQHRLETSGITTRREEGVACCYAKQTKFWVPDPDRVLWEIYVLHEDIDEHGDDHVPDAEELNQPSSEAASPRVVWQHRVGEPVPERIPHEDFTVHEVVLEGTANLKPASLLEGLLVEARRVLRPGGEVHLHGLSGDMPLNGLVPELPGPAAVVEHVPSHAEVVQTLIEAGFVDIRLEQLSATAHFKMAGVPLRELRVVARKPGHRPSLAGHQAIYLGPLNQVMDDAGNVFRRGESVVLNVHDWRLLSKSSAADFLLLAPSRD